MRSLVEFQKEMAAVMQRLGSDPTPEAVESAGRELVKDGVPAGANLEGMLLLRDLARERAAKETRPNDDSRSRTRDPRRPR
jgi:hypothetical protein